MPHHSSAHQVHFADDAIGTPPVTHQLTVPGHGNQAAAQRLVGLVICMIQLLRQLRQRSGPLSFLQVIQDEFAADDGVFVLFSLASKVRIFLGFFLLYHLTFHNERTTAWSVSKHCAKFALIIATSLSSLHEITAGEKNLYQTLKKVLTTPHLPGKVRATDRGNATKAPPKGL